MQTTGNVADLSVVNDRRHKDYIQGFTDSDEVTNSQWASEYKARLDNYTLKNLFLDEDWVFITVDLLASELSGSYLRVMREEVVNGKTVRKPDEGYWLQKVFDKPNQMQSQASFIYRMYVEFFLMGNAICWYSRAARRMWPLSAETVMLEFNRQTSMLSKYLWYPDDEYEQQQRKASVAFPAEDIIHLRRPNPKSLYWGLSPFIPGRKSVLFDRYSQEYINNFYLKGAQPGIVLESDNTANMEMLDRLTKSFDMQYSGRRNQRRTLALPKGVKASKMSHTLVEQDFIEIVKLNRDKVLNILRIPKHAVGLQESGSLGSEEHKTALKYLWVATLKPAQKALEDYLTDFFAAELNADGRKRVVAFDNEQIEVLHEDEKAKAELAELMKSSMTLNEIRAKVWELPPLPGGDQLPGSAAPFGQSPGMVPGQGTESRPLPGSPASGTPSPEEAPKPPLPPSEQEPQEDEEESFPVERWLKEAPEAGEALSAHLKGVETHVGEKRDELETLAGDTILALVREGVRIVKDSLSEKAEPEGLRARIAEAFETLSEQWESAYVRSLRGSVDVGYKQQLGLILRGEARDAVDAVGSKDRVGRTRILRARGIDTFASVSETTTNEIMAKVQEGMSLNASPASIARSIVGYFAERAWSRAQTIARTETLTAVSIGQAGAMKATQKVFPGAIKVWITADDERVRGRPGGLYEDSKADHWSLHGQKRKPDKAFSNGLQFPRDPKSGKAAEVINCRCTFVTVLPEDYEALTGNVKPNK